MKQTNDIYNLRLVGFKSSFHLKNNQPINQRNDLVLVYVINPDTRNQSTNQPV
jgi:hypothetical protein